MGFYAESLKLQQNTFALFQGLILQRTGLLFDENKRETLEYKLSPLVLERGFGSFLDYYYLLRYDEAAADEWKRVIDALTIQETYFWREVDQIRALAETIVPGHFADAPDGPLRIWSAPCATGEEPLSIAIALDIRGHFDRWPIEIVATDISGSAIARAREGVYRERALRNLPAELRERYFHRRGTLWQIDEGLQRRIRFGVVNLLDDAEASPLAAAGVIFCRNLFIYLSKPAIERVVGMFHERMPSPGYLFVAASESLLRISTGFTLREIGGAFVYVKP